MARTRNPDVQAGRPCCAIQCNNNMMYRDINMSYNMTAM